MKWQQETVQNALCALWSPLFGDMCNYGVIGSVNGFAFAYSDPFIGDDWH